jgi:hypothetical protein
MITRIRRALFGSAAPEPAPSLTLPGLVIEGVEAFVVEGVPTGAVRFCAPGHPWNPTERNILACDLDTYVSLAARPDSQRLVAIMVHDAVRALRLKAEAAERRQRRNAKRIAHHSVSHGS